MAGSSTNALGPAGSQVITVTSGPWRTTTMSWTCSNPADPNAGAWLEGSADGSTFFPLRGDGGSPASQTGTGVKFYRDQPVNAVQVFVTCSPGNTVTATVTGI